MSDIQTIKNIIFPQKFSTQGVRVLSLQKNNLALYEFFQEVGLGDSNFVYATDVAKLKAHLDKDKDGKLSLESARKMGIKGNDRVLNSAIQFLEVIVSHDLDEQENYPLKLNETESVYYNKDGQIIKRTIFTIKDGVMDDFTEIIYVDGDPNKISKKYVNKTDGTLHYTEYYENDLSRIGSEAVSSKEGLNKKKIYTYDQKNRLKSCYETGNNYHRVTMYDDKERELFVREDMGYLVKRTTNIYDDKENRVTQKIEGDPKFLKDGISAKQFVFKMNNGQITNELISAINIMFDGNIVEITT